VLIPRDTTANRPGTPADGMIRYNTTDSKFEFYQGGAWVTYGTGGGTVSGVSASAPLSSTGGTTPAISLTGVIAIANGGTNSSTALNNNRVMASSGGKIVEAPAITASRALASDANGIPVAVATTATELGYVNGVTSAIQTQLLQLLQLVWS
jgi:trimeric autotransporter adhesin